ncbi:hypothetical protein NM688_g2762 [Phlebia brevispora]|uniref:Uncharacterized protein n=1 Tax=Phlebia brevispora TaxID=194682 RepID=A0ACC1T7F4_9APHY|nr:hypothetical protein NM688_g2762 [Phlebia brevispora]
MDEIYSMMPQASSSSPRAARLRKTPTTSRDTLHTFPERGQPPRLKTPTLFPRSPSIGIRSNTSDTDHSEIIAPIPRKHMTIQRNESQHWLGSPPLSPVSTVSRALSPASSTFLDTANPRGLRRHTQSFSSLLEHDKPASGSIASSVPRARPPAENKNEETSPARRWARWIHKQGLKQLAIPLILLVSTLVRWCIGLGSYSGQGTPIMFGDYEAQRHWMELTIHLPFRQWYTYDLPYWGLDYPPLTAYVSWLCGIVGSWIDPTWFALYTSRGIETPGSKVYMRATVVFFDLLVYIPSVILFTHTWQSNRSSRTQHVALLTLLFQPALLLIDFGHFQYNSVMLGFTLLAIDLFAKGQDVLGAICFVLSLGFKQMALYYAPAIGSYLLAKCLCLGFVEGSRLFIRLAIVTSISFVILFLPWLPPFAPIPSILAPISRIFPFARGLFEDKVANFWCASNIVFKWRLWLSRDTLVKLSAVLTALGFFPSVTGLLYHGYQVGASEKLSKKETSSNAPPVPILPLLPYALLASSMSFFLFSFQVHEKTILVPLLPLTLLVSGSSPSSFTFQLGVLVNNVAVFSMWPLLQRDGLALQYFAVTLLWNRLIGYNPLKYKPGTLVHYIPLVIYAACFTLHVLETLIPPPARLPDIYPVLNVLISTPVFAFTWLWAIKRGIEVGWAIGGLGHAQASSPSSSSALAASRSKQSVDGQGANGSERAVKSAVEAAGLGLGAPSVDRAAGLRTRSLGYAQARRASSALRDPF